MSPVEDYSPSKVWRDFLHVRESTPMFVKYRAEHPELGDVLGTEKDYGKYRVQYCAKGLIICEIGAWQAVTHVMLEDGEGALPSISVAVVGSGRAIDISNWTGKVSRETFEAIKAQGYDTVIVGTQNQGIARVQMENAREAGMNLDAYGWLGWDADTKAQVQRELGVIEGYPVRTMWLDVEEEPAPEPTTVVNMIQQAIDACAGVDAGIYTSRSKWLKLTGNYTGFSDLKLWAAFYTSDDDMANWGGPFGGWQQCAMRQHKGDVVLSGIKVDLNVYACK